MEFLAFKRGLHVLGVQIFILEPENRIILIVNHSTISTIIHHYPNPYRIHHSPTIPLNPNIHSSISIEPLTIINPNLLHFIILQASR
ncbi:hypothetical protein HanIR_Chr12g0570391 [Helianthus annuus]|nr:hypothetical protein HanIR_Chr12g0570391 [Helianthus annuus]